MSDLVWLHFVLLVSPQDFDVAGAGAATLRDDGAQREGSEELSRNNKDVGV